MTAASLHVMGSVLYQLLAAMHADRTIWHVPECHVDWLEVLVILVCYRPPVAYLECAKGGGLGDEVPRS